MNKAILTILSFFLVNVIYSQITKGNYILSGTASFSTINNTSEGTGIYKQTNLIISPSIGYFLKDKFVVGIRPSITYGTTSISSGNSETIFTVGPFMRYYILKADKVFNILTDGGYSYSSFNTAGIKLRTFSFAAGPVVYFNPSVGLEFLIGYSSTRVAQFTGSNKELRFSLGFQYSLEKER